MVGNLFCVGELPFKIRRFRWFASPGSAAFLTRGLPDTADPLKKNVPFDQNA
jgi:hypothetical protein